MFEVWDRELRVDLVAPLPDAHHLPFLGSVSRTRVRRLEVNPAAKGSISRRVLNANALEKRLQDLHVGFNADAVRRSCDNMRYEDVNRAERPAPDSRGPSVRMS
jgi:hypothetical protein